MKLNKEMKESEHNKQLLLKRNESNSSFKKLTSIQLPSILRNESAYENLNGDYKTSSQMGNYPKF